MGRRSQPNGRFSLRRAMHFEPLEAAIAVTSFLVALIAITVIQSEIDAIGDLTDNGHCLDAEVEEAGWLKSLRLGKSADLTFAVDGVRYHATLHYQSDQTLQKHSTVRICTDPADPTTFGIDSYAITGDSTDLWLRGVIAAPIGSVGAIVFVLLLSKHQWRFHDKDSEQD
ncbi:hypothetical protein [Couchioplanes azureus]|uniref:hypothetical protein n=1 Tax=Couchioplanes caeruleus TaxID=56438 RepID=UPI001670EEAD|nr:hypothetical protein [Couchioplanes caeruleus]GGQ84678.1 hypothetical protein GCM10010166_63600 [Couchioplanes caeruleus subsp. azureus]